MALSCSQAKSWVKTHYERHEEGVVAKAVMYKHYEEFCREQSRNIMETSIFGRVVKSVFPDVTIRRLGGRDNLKYYYCGIRAKETSIYAIDNATTTRPKRRLRKRELVTDKMEVHNCLRWLHAHYAVSSEASVVKTDVYEGYLAYCRPRGGEPLSIQYFGMVVTHAFPSVTKRKLGPRTNQQKYYFGIQKRPNPMSLDHVPCEYLSTIDEVLRNGRSSYREKNLDNTDEEDDYPCQSPESDLSDIASQHGLHTVSYESEMRSSPPLQEYPFDRFLKDTEPVDYSLSSLQLKDEPIEEEVLIKQEPLDLHISRDQLEERRTPDRPPSVSTFVSSHSPSPPTKEGRTRKIYKPRFHYYYDDSPWNDDPPAEVKREESSEEHLLESQSAVTLRQWVLHNFEELKGVHVNRDQIYEMYEKYCAMFHVTLLPMATFDEVILKIFRGVVTMIHPSGKTFYEGIHVRSSSPLFGRVEELYQEDTQWGDEETVRNPMELSPADGSTSHSSPLTLEEEEGAEEGFSFHAIPTEEDLQATPEVLRDGKFYLKKWLTDNFHSVPDSCVLKADAYRHYDAYARGINQTPFEMNVFGKIVRQVFPNVSIRRLGGRVKPQYHYCGIAVKPSSPLHHHMSGKDPAQRSRKKEIATDNRSAEVVIDFLRRHYNSGKDQSIMKSEVFENYCAFCASLGENPVTLNYFGKLVKYCFPNVEVRKFGGRTEPTWYYFGLAPRGGTPSSSSSPYKYAGGVTYQDDPALREAHSPAGILPLGCDGGPRPSTSPIPISAQRTQLSSPGGGIHYAGSPSALLNSHLQSSLRVSSYEEASHGSPAEGTQFYRESIMSHSPAPDVFYSQSPVDVAPSKGLYPAAALEGIYPREGLQTHHKNVPYPGGGQIVPSQTPPNLSLAQGIDHSIGVHLHKRARRPPFAIQEEYELFNDMPME